MSKGEKIVVVEHCGSHDERQKERDIFMATAADNILCFLFCLFAVFYYVMIDSWETVQHRKQRWLSDADGLTIIIIINVFPKRESFYDYTCVRLKALYMKH